MALRSVDPKRPRAPKSPQPEFSLHMGVRAMGRYSGRRFAKRRWPTIPNLSLPEPPHTAASDEPEPRITAPPAVEQLGQDRRGTSPREDRGQSHGVGAPHRDTVIGTVTSPHRVVASKTEGREELNPLHTSERTGERPIESQRSQRRGASPSFVCRSGR